MDEGKPEVVAAALRSLVNDELTGEAAELFRRYRHHQPDKECLAAVYGAILIEAGRLDEAERLLEAELGRHPQRSDLLLALGRLDEKRGQHLSALDLFQRAAQAASSPGERRLAAGSLERVKERIKSTIYFEDNSFLLRLEGNRKPLQLRYNLPRLTRRAELLEALLDQLDPGSRSVLELESDGGVVARNLAGHGFSVEGAAAEMTEIMLAIGLDYAEMLRRPGGEAPHYYQLSLDGDTAAGLEPFDVILLLPSRPDWYKQRGPAASAALLKLLAERSRRQFFFYLPPGTGEELGQALAATLTAALSGEPRRGGAPYPCHRDRERGILYRLDRPGFALPRGAIPGSSPRAELLPRGLAAAAGRSEIFEIPLSHCRSLNAFAFHGQGWNHFTAQLLELRRHPRRSFQDSTLRRFYERFRPANRREQLFGPGREALPPLDGGWTVPPWLEGAGLCLNPATSPRTRPGGNHHYGPNSSRFGREELSRLQANAALMERYGYRPQVFPDGYVQGYLLKDGTDYRFIVNEGQHRLAALALTGAHWVRVRFNPDYPALVDRADLKDWPQVAGGLYSPDVAARYFDLYFSEDGRRRAAALGLLPGESPGRRAGEGNPA